MCQPTDGLLSRPSRKRAALNDRLTALRLGADDYLIRPFALQELLARVDAVSRRHAEARALTLRVAI